jgi:hypothetical protein
MIVEMVKIAVKVTETCPWNTSATKISVPWFQI